MDKNTLLEEIQKILTKTQRKANVGFQNTADCHELVLELSGALEKLRLMQSFYVLEEKVAKSLPVMPEIVQEKIKETSTLSIDFSEEKAPILPPPTEPVFEIKKPESKPESSSQEEPKKPVHEVLSTQINKSEVNQKVASKNLALDLNDRIYLQRELFNNDSEFMRIFLDKILTQSTIEDKLQYIASQEWDLEKDSVKRLIQIIEKTF